MIASVAIFLAAGTLIWRIVQSQKQFRITFFMDYTRRYHGIFTNLPLNIMSNHFDPSVLSAEKQEEYEVWIRAYFDLCSEEFHVSRKGLIDQDVWDLWEGGMNSAFVKPAFLQVWTKISDHGYFDPEFIAFVKSKH